MRTWSEFLQGARNRSLILAALTIPGAVRRSWVNTPYSANRYLSRSQAKASPPPGGKASGRFLNLDSRK